MDYYLQILLKGYSRKHLTDLKGESMKHKPHITIVRPFNIHTTEQDLERRIRRVCMRQKDYIYYELGGVDYFNKKQKVIYMKVNEEDELLKLSNTIETAITPIVSFSRSFGKKLHATIDYTSEEDFQKKMDWLKKNAEDKIEQYLLRLTLNKNKQVYKQFDFTNKQCLSKEEAFDKELWKNSMLSFTEQTRLIPTKDGFRFLNELYKG